MHQVTLITNVEQVINSNLFYFIINCLVDSHYSFVMQCNKVVVVFFLK
jgi:hypothetical protein